MKLTKNFELFAAARRIGLVLGLCLMGTALGLTGNAQAISTTAVQGTVYLANGQAGAGTLSVSWPAFTTANGQLVVAGQLMVTIAPDGFVSVNLTPNVGATPAGLFYTAVYQMSDGTTSTQYWVIPAAAQASLAQVQARLMPASQAVQAVSKAYVDQSLAELEGSLLTTYGGTLSGPLYLDGDPTQPLQAADKHYVDSTSSMEVPVAGGSMTGPLVLSGDPTAASQAADKHYVDAQVSTALPMAGGAVTGELTGQEIGAAYQADQFPGVDFGAKLQACLGALSGTYGGTCDARNFTGNLSMGSNLTLSTGNATVLLPCATVSTANQLIVTAGTRNVALRGCSLRGASTASGSQGGTVFLYSGTGAMVQVGDPAYAADTMGFRMDNAVINTTAASNSTAQGLVAYRTQEMDIESLYLLGNSNQTGMTLDGTGNYTGGSFSGNQISGFQTALNAIGHTQANAATTDWMNASTFVRLHIDCPTSGGNPIAGTIGINLQQGDGNTFTGGDVESCSTALHLGASAQNNTFVGLRNENSTNQVVADAGSSYNNWIAGGTMFTGQLTDNGTRNSFLDSFHRSFNGMRGDWYGSQQDATVTNHLRLGIGLGNERGLLNEVQTDYGYRWIEGFSDATAGEQFYQVQDLLNNVNRLSIGQFNNGQSGTNNQTVINGAGSGAVVLNGSNNAGTGGVVFGSGGPSETTVATIGNTGNAQFNGSLQVAGASTFIGTPTVKNQIDTEIDAVLWAGLTQSQKESLIYKDYNGSSQWYAEKDASNNWELNSAIGGLDSFKAYQSTNSGDTYVNASNSTGVVRVNYENGSGSGFNVYGGNSGTLYAGFTGAGSIKFPGLAASSGHNCMQIDNSGFMTNTGAACGTGSGTGSGTVGSANSGQVAYYTGNGTTIGGITTVGVTAGGTGSGTPAGALANLGALPLAGGTLTGLLTGTSASFSGSVSVGSKAQFPTSVPVNVIAFGADPTAVNDSSAAVLAAATAAATTNPNTGTNLCERVYFPPGEYLLHEVDLSGLHCIDLEGSNAEPANIYYNGAGVGGVQQSATIGNMAVTSGVLTAAVSTMATPFAAGQTVLFNGLTGATMLNGIPVTVVTSTSTSFTANVGSYYSTYAPASDTGTAITDTYLFKLGSLSSGGIQELRLYGYNPAMTTLANNLIVVNGYIDRLAKMADLAFEGSAGDAFVESGGFANWSVDGPIRFDSIGGYVFNMANPSANGTPFDLEQFTYDNNISGTMASLATSIAGYDGTHWGKGIILANNAGNVQITFGTGSRVELNKLLIANSNGEAALVYQANNSAGVATVVNVEKITGSFGASTARRYPLVSAATFGSVILTTIGGSPEAILCPMIMRDTMVCSGDVTSTGTMTQYGHSQSSASRGIEIEGQKIMPNLLSNLSGVSQVRYQAGDLILHPAADVSGGQRGIGQMVVGPNPGWSRPDGATIISNGVVTSGSSTISWPSTTGITEPFVNDNLVLHGAGVSGANLNAIVTSVNWNSGTMTVSPMPSTSVNPATIGFQTPVFQEIGMDATRMSAAPSSGTWYRGNIVWNSAPTAGGTLGWVCTASGTPGTWAGFTLNTGGAVAHQDPPSSSMTGTGVTNFAGMYSGTLPTLQAGMCVDIVASWYRISGAGAADGEWTVTDGTTPVTLPVASYTVVTASNLNHSKFTVCNRQGSQTGQLLSGEYFTSSVWQGMPTTTASWNTGTATLTATFSFAALTGDVYKPWYFTVGAPY